MDLEMLPSQMPTYKILLRALRNDVTFVTGPPSTGKTTMVKRAFEVDYAGIFLGAYVDCYSMPNQSRLLSTICRSYSGSLNVSLSKLKKTGTRQPDDQDETVGLANFPRYLDEYTKLAMNKGYQSIYVILDHLEVFEKTNLLDTFVALCRAVTQSLIELRLVIISYEDPQDIIHYVTQKSTSIGLSLQARMQVVSCSVWSKEDIIDWVLRLPPKYEEMHELYSKFVRNIVALVYSSDSKDARQIRTYCQQNFADFLEYRKLKTKAQIRKLLKLDPDATLEDDVMKEYSLGDNYNTGLVQSFLTSHRNIADKSRAGFRWTHKDSEIKLNVNTSRLIVAAYVAAYTRPSDDKWNFISSRRRQSCLRGGTKDCGHNKPFNLERLMQIFMRLTQRSLGDRDLNIVYYNDCALADIERLENLNILQHQGGYELSSESRYKLSPNIRREYVQRLAEQVDLSLEWFNGLALN